MPRSSPMANRCWRCGEFFRIYARRDEPTVRISSLCFKEENPVSHNGISWPLTTAVRQLQAFGMMWPEVKF